MRNAPSLVLATLGALAVGLGLAAAMRQASPTVVPGTAPSDPPVAVAPAAGPAGASGTLVALAEPAGAAAAVTPSPAPLSRPSAQVPMIAGAARRIALDPVTGERTEATWASPAAPLPALASAPASEPVMRYHADGSVSTRVPEELLPQLVARVGSDGRVVVECVHSGYRHDAAAPHQPPAVPAAPEEE